MPKQEKLQNSISSIDVSEIAKFTAMAEDWWNPAGKFRPLHQLNPLRIEYIRDHIAAHFRKSPRTEPILSGLRILDVGCGGGLLCEPLARLGAEVTGIDAAERNIQIARIHAEQMGIKVTYLPCPVEALPKSELFDVVLAMEIVEHVADLDLFLWEAVKRVKPGGLLFVATLNRTLKSYAFAILGAEYLLRWLPIGTHEWQKFVRPSELAAALRKSGMTLRDMRGVTFAPFQNRWSLSKDLDVNYMLVAER